jgi:glyoxylase-like metal-dependent hydrolase (beta-lactamase superfamily II)
MYQPKRKPYPLPPQIMNTWNDALSNPGDITLEPLETGRLHISNHMFLNMRHPNARELKREKITVPVYCYLIRHSKQGNYLVDAGLDRSFQDNPHGNIQGPLRKLFWPLKSHQQKGKDIGTRLQEKGIDVKGVFFTHLHMDHISGIQTLPKNITLVKGKNESDYRVWPLFFQDNFNGFDTIYEIDFHSARILPPLGKCIDIFGDGSFWAVDTPGHRKGHVSYLVNGKEKAVLLTGDACDIKLGFDFCVGPGFGSHSKRLAQKSLERMIEFKNTYPQVQVFFGHEIPE